jgi:thermitase
MKYKLCLGAATLALTSLGIFGLDCKPKENYYVQPPTIQQDVVSYESISSDNETPSLIQHPEISKPAIVNDYTTVAVVDTGINKDDIELIGKVIGEKNFTDSPTTNDTVGHGTYIAKIIVEAENDYSKLYGLKCDCRLMNVKVTDSVVFLDGKKIAQGIIWATDNGANVINVSLYYSEPCQEMKDAVNYAWNHGVLLVASAGDFTKGKFMYPANYSDNYSNCISVASAYTDGSIAEWSINSHWDVLAPGTKIFTLSNNQKRRMIGSSVSTAYFSGLADFLFKTEVDTNGNGRINDEIIKKIKQIYRFELKK